MLTALSKGGGLNCMDKLVLLISLVIISEAIEDAAFNSSAVPFVLSHVCSHSTMMWE